MKTFSHRAWSARIAVVLLGLLISTSCGRDGVSPTAPGSANLDRHGDWGSIKAPTLKLSDESVRFEDVEGEVDVSPVSVKVTVKDGDVQLTGLTVTSTSSPAGWLNATLDATTTPTRVVISVTSQDLEPDEYKGSVVVTAPGADKSPDEIKVRLSIDKAHRQLFVATAPAGAVAGVAFTTQPVIQIRMVPSNKLSRDNDKVTAQIVGFPGLLGGTTTVKAHNGVATFTNLSVPTAGTYTLLFTAEDDASASVQLTVTPPQVQLTVNYGTGNGTGSVTPSPAWNSCSPAATGCYSYAVGTPVTLTASRGSGSSVTWIGCTPGNNTDTCTVTMNATTTVTATFQLATFTLTVSKVGLGTGTVTCSADGGPFVGCSATYPSTTTVILNAVAGDGSIFTGWGPVGDCSGTTCSVIMGADKSVTANFAQLVLTSVAISGTPGSLTVGGTAQLTASPLDQFGHPIAATVTWSSSTTAATVSPTTGLVTTVTAASAGSATITATATSGAVSVSSTTPSITINPVVQSGFTLTVNISGSGSITSTPAGINCTSSCSFNFATGTPVTLTFAGSPDYFTFDWTGCTPSDPDNAFVCTLTMDGNKSVTATIVNHEHLASAPIRLVSVAIAER
jgi:hypothetical protein